MTSTNKSFISPFILGIAFLGMCFSQAEYSRAKTPLPEIAGTLPSASVLKKIDFGLHESMASLIWLKINQGVYTWLDKSKKYERFSKEILILVELDPKWGYPYAFGTLLLPDFGMIDEAIKLGEKGIKNVPDDWRIPYYLAMVYNGNLNDRMNAAKYFALASATKSAPDNVKEVARVYGTQKNKLDEMLTIWRTLFENADNEMLRNQAEKNLLYIEELKKRQNQAQ